MTGKKGLIITAFLAAILLVGGIGYFLYSDFEKSALPPDLSKFKYFTLCEDVNNPARVVWKEYSMEPRYGSLADTAYSFTALDKNMTFMVYLDKKNMKSKVSSDLVITIKGWQFFVEKNGIWKEVSKGRFLRLLRATMPDGYWDDNIHIIKKNFKCTEIVTEY